VSTELDRLDLELRCVPGVVGVGLDQDGGGLVVQVVVVAAVSAADLRERVRRVIQANVRESVTLEVVIDSVTAAG
jgi:hypothetical protein